MRAVVGGAFLVLVALSLAVAGAYGVHQGIAEGDGGVLFLAGLALVLPLLLAGAVIVAIVAAVVPALRHGGHKRAQSVMTVALAAVLGVGVYAFNADVPVQRPDAAVTSAVARACAGQPVPEAGALHTDGSVRNHLVVLDATGAEHDWTGKPPIEWRPPSVDDVEVVACVDAEDTVTLEEVCRYNGPSTTRYSATREVRVVAARTGAQLARFSITEEADACPAAKVGDQTPEIKASVDWPIVKAHLASFIQDGTFVDPDASSTAQEPITSFEPVPTLETSEPIIRTRELTLQKALADGDVTAKGIGDNLERLDLRVTSKSTDDLRIRVDAGTFLDPGRSATQTMVVITSTTIDLPALETVTETLDVACDQMHDDQPGSSDHFTVRTKVATGSLRKLLASEAFAQAEFRIQQFAVWTITSNPAKGAYVGLGFSSDGSGPGASELRKIKSIFRAAGIDPSRYRALK